MAKKEFRYKGKSIQELKEMSLEQFSELCNSRTRRSLKRGFDKHLLKKISKGKEKTIKTHKRDTVVIPEMVGLKFAIHKGNSFETIEIKPEMLGHFLGEFALTRKRLMHGKAGIGATRSSTAISARK